MYINIYTYNYTYYVYVPILLYKLEFLGNIILRTFFCH